VLDTIGYAILIIVPALLFGFFSTEATILGVVSISHFVSIIALGFAILMALAIFYAMRPDFTLKIISLFKVRMPRAVAVLISHIEIMLRDSSLWLSNPKKVLQILFWTFTSILCYSVCLF
jgi:hypothetical protein